MKYDAFLSYSHEADAQLASEVQSALQGIARPWLALRALHVFRDKSSLSANPALWTAVEAALESSRFFLLMASPRGASSPWVEREVGWWLAHRSSETLLILVSDGDLKWVPDQSDFDWSKTNCLPKILHGVYRDVPLYVDLRWARDEPKLSARHTRFRGAVLDLAAPLHGKPKDELDGEDVRQFQKARRLRWSAGIALAVLAVGTSLAAYLARREAEEADAQRRVAMARHLASQAEVLTKREARFLRASILVAAEALQTPSLQADQTMRYDLALLPRLVAVAKNNDMAGAMALAEDGRYFATVGKTRRVLVKEITTDLKIINVCDLDHEASAGPIAFSPDGSFLATMTHEGRIRLWALPACRELRDSNGHITPSALALGPGGRYLAVADSKHGVRVWDSVRGQELGRTDNRTAVLGLKFSPDGKYLCVRHSLGVDILEYPSFRRIAQLPHDMAVVSASFHPKGAYVATASVDAIARAWDIPKGREVARMRYEKPVGCIAFSPDGRYLAAGSADQTARVWDWASNPPHELARMIHDAQVLLIAFTQDGSHLETVDAGGGVLVWETIPATNVLGMTGQEHATSVAFSHDNGRVASVTETGRVRIWSLTSRSEILDAKSNESVVQVFFALNDEELITVAEDGVAHRWLLGKRLSPVLNACTVGPPVAFSKDAKYMAVISTGRRVINVLDATTCQEFAQIGDADDISTAVRVKTSGGYATWSATRSLNVWKLPTGKKTGPIPVSAEPNVVEFNPDGRYLAVASDDGIAGIWEASARKQVAAINHEGAVMAATFSPDGECLVTGGWDHMAHIWQWKNNVEIARVTVPGTVMEVAFSPNGKFLATASWDGSTQVWLWKSKDLTAEACSRVTRNLTNKEWLEYVGSIPVRKTCEGLP